MERLGQECGRTAFLNIQDYQEEDSLTTDLTRLPPGKVAAVATVEITRSKYKGITTTLTEFKPHSKIAAPENLGNYLSLFEKDNSQRDPARIIAE